MSVIGAPQKFHERARFVVEIPGFSNTGFAKCSELKASVSLRKHYEGGSALAHKGPGLFEVENVTLERGATTDLQLYDWFSQVAQLASGTGQVDPHFKRDISIVQLSRSGTPIMRWHLYNAFPIEFVAGEWDASSSEITIGKIVLAFDYFAPKLEARNQERNNNAATFVA